MLPPVLAQCFVLYLAALPSPLEAILLASEMAQCFKLVWWHAVCIPAGMGAFFHGIWVIAVAIESARFSAWRVCPGQGPVYDVALGGLLAVFCLSAVNQTVMTFISLRGDAFLPKYNVAMVLLLPGWT